MAVSKTEKGSGPFIEGIGTSWLTRRSPQWRATRVISIMFHREKQLEASYEEKTEGLRACYINMVKSSIFKKKKKTHNH